jgi:hypothetical protein
LTPLEILAELDRLGIRVWWSAVGGQGRHSRSPKIRVPRSAPPELCEAIREHNDELIRIMARRKGASLASTTEILNHRRCEPCGLPLRNRVLGSSGLLTSPQGAGYAQ